VDVSADLRSITGSEITLVTLGYDVWLTLVDPDDPLRLDAQLVLGVPFELHRGGAVQRVDAEQIETLSQVVGLLRRRLLSASADEDLNLTLEFDDGTTIVVERSDLYEAWQLHGKGVAGVLAGPR
jgi:hypothetical protein